MEVEQEPIEVPSDSPSDTTPPQEPEEELDADKIKEQGNTAFKAGRFHEAIEHYSRAIGTSLFLLWNEELFPRRLPNSHLRPGFTPFAPLCPYKSVVLRERTVFEGLRASLTCVLPSSYHGPQRPSSVDFSVRYSLNECLLRI